MTIHVVAAVIADGERFLVTQRLAGTHLAGLWEFPGGKIDPGETHDAALRRELLEELGVDATVDKLLLETTHHYAARSVTLYFYRCTLAGEPRPLLGQSMRWVRRDELATIGLPPADDELVRLLMGRDAY